jgi:hypothetical protein
VTFLAIGENGDDRVIAATAKYGAPLFGIAIVAGLWWIGGLLLEANPRYVAFDGFTIGRALAALIINCVPLTDDHQSRHHRSIPPTHREQSRP